MWYILTEISRNFHTVVEESFCPCFDLNISYLNTKDPHHHDNDGSELTLPLAIFSSIYSLHCHLSSSSSIRRLPVLLPLFTLATNVSYKNFSDETEKTAFVSDFFSNFFFVLNHLIGTPIQ